MYTTPPSAARSARNAPVGASLQTSTADPEEVTPIRHPLAIRDNPVVHTGGEMTHRLTIPRDARPARLSYFRLLTIASQHWRIYVNL
jgi:hypothetical protein